MRSPIAVLLVVLLALAARAGATWSIVLVDRCTGEVAIGSATCLESFDLERFLPVVVVGKGAGAAQSQVDTTGANRLEIWDGLMAGKSPQAIGQEDLKVGDLFLCSRQYGIADMGTEPWGFTGNCAGAYKEHIKGTIGDCISYAIQGNILTGAPVIAEALDAVSTTTGLLSDRLMAGMQAARAMGGDGRCSCLTGGATSCGSPPNGGDFEKSAHVGFMIVARMGDLDGTCNAASGCASGDYWMDHNVIGGDADPDPVETLQQMYDAFLLDQAGRPDGLLSTWVWDDIAFQEAPSLVRDLKVTLRDIDGVPLTRGGHLVTVQHAEDSAGNSPRQAVVDHGDGTYTIHVLVPPGLDGTDRLQITFDDGTTRATLWPFPEILHGGTTGG